MVENPSLPSTKQSLAAIPRFRFHFKTAKMADIAHLPKLFLLALLALHCAAASALSSADKNEGLVHIKDGDVLGVVNQDYRAFKVIHPPLALPFLPLC